MPDETSSTERLGERGELVVAVNADESSRVAAGLALELAAELDLQARFIHILESAAAAAREQAEKRFLEWRAELAERSGFVVPEIEFGQGEVGPAFAALCESSPAPVELVLVGRRPLSPVSRLVLGRVSLEIVRALGRPVLVVPPHRAELHREGPVVVATDLSAASTLAFQPARRLANGRELVLAHVGRTEPQIEDQLRELAQELVGGEGFARILVRPGEPQRVILSLLRQTKASALVIATRARQGYERMFGGSLCDAILEEAEIPVLICQQGSKKGAE